MDRLVLRFLLSYHRFASWEENQQLRPAGRIGYEAEMELPVAKGLHLTGATSYSPVDMTFQSYPRGGIEAPISRLARKIIPR